LGLLLIIFQTMSLQNVYNNPKVKQFITEVKNPSFEHTHMHKEQHTGIIGATGTGKTSAYANYLRLSQNEYKHMVVVYRGVQEPIYQALEATLGEKGQITFFTLDTLPDCQELFNHKEDEEDAYCIVFDDVIADLHNNRNHKAKVTNYFLVGRKLHFTCFFLSQSYYQIPKTVRLQLSYVLLLKVNSTNDLRMVLRDYALGVDMSQLQAIYNAATALPMNFLKIDVGTSDLNKKFERNFTDAFFATPHTNRDGTEGWTVTPGPWFRRPAPPKISRDIHYF